MVVLVGFKDIFTCIFCCRTPNMQHRKLHVAYVVELFTQGEERHVLGLLTDHLVILSNISVNTQNFKKKATQLALSVSQE